MDILDWFVLLKTMTPLSVFLDLHYSLSKLFDTRFTRRPSPAGRTLGRQLSGLAANASFRPSTQATFLLNPKEMRGVFDMIDRDRDGRLCRWDLRQLLDATRPMLTPEEVDEEVDAMLSMAGDGACLTFRDFVEVHKKGARAGEMQKAFWVLDADEDGRIGAEDVMQVLRTLGERCGLEECGRIVRKVGRRRDGLVDMEDFMAMMTRTLKLAN